MKGKIGNKRNIAMEFPKPASTNLIGVKYFTFFAKNTQSILSHCKTEYSQQNPYAHFLSVFPLSLYLTQTVLLHFLRLTSKSLA